MAQRRHYRLGRRGEAARATRQRIVEATLGLHDEQGITGTTFRDVASRAGVAPATVLRHFPRMGQLIEACGAVSEEMAPFPGPGVLAGARSKAERTFRVVAAIFGWYDIVGRGLEHLQIDRRSLPELDAWFRRIDGEHRSLLALAIDREPDDELVTTATALTTPGAWASMLATGMDSDRAARTVARHVIGFGRQERSA
jgi:AcrR family transcriptional regulator